MVGRGDIDWDNVPLGIESDRAIAKRLGVHRWDARAERMQRGIAPCISLVKGIDWDSVDLGQRPDADIARELGVRYTTVRSARKSRGIDPNYETKNANLNRSLGIRRRLAKHNPSHTRLILDELQDQISMTNTDICEAIGITAGVMSDMRVGTMGPLDMHGRVRPSAQKIADFHGVGPSYIWPEIDPMGDHWEDLDSAQSIPDSGTRPDKATELRQLFTAAISAFDKITPDQQTILRRLYLEDEPTLRALSLEMTIGHEWVRQLRNNALKMLRNYLSVERERSEL